MIPVAPERRSASVRPSAAPRLPRVLSVVAVWIVFVAAGAWWLVLRPAQQLDRLAAEREADICEAFLDAEMSRLRATALDWANWDDLENYLLDPQDEFAVENVTQTALRNLDIDGMLLVKKDGALQRREVAGPNRSLYMGSAVFLKRIADLRARAAQESAASALVGEAGHLYVVAAAPVLGTDATGSRSGEVIVFSIVTNADLGDRPGLEGSTISLLPPDTQLVETGPDGGKPLVDEVVVTRAITGPDGSAEAQIVVRHAGTQAELARRAALYFTAAGVLLAVGLYAFCCAAPRGAGHVA
jgi:hypothetical protein